MKKLILPVVLGMFGLGVGAGAGYFLRKDATATTAEDAEEPAAPPEYAKLANQFIVPVLEDGAVVSLVVLSLSLEVSEGATELVYQNEPKLRDEFLQVLFNHANSGGFRGSFTDSANLVPLRMALFEAASVVMPGVVTDVLIGDIVRQDT
ncbi:flagellar basal body-associated protein FliL [Paragemmobacter ruber]|uniref:Flagellar basal body-associated protein FliL n=1 Tax=Paragemmobacter ruber TaxID=1985673 RepID=A0ABW9Y5B0_9RHOB|nr:flagellar basal body-associated protein FliL [Rhodobacter ruber]NBE07379.1 flagellar basal body-associated protein FliL [Rhodobacter ruber]